MRKLLAALGKLSLGTKVILAGVTALAIVGSVPTVRLIGDGLQTLSVALSEAHARYVFSANLQQRVFLSTDDAVGISIGNDASIKLDGRPVALPVGVESLVLNGGSLHVPAGQTRIFTSTGQPVTLSIGENTVAIDGAGQGIIFGNGTLFLTGKAQFLAEGFSKVAGAGGARVVALRAGSTRTRDGAQVIVKSTLTEYDLYLVGQKLLKQRIFDQAKTTGIEVTDTGVLKVDGKLQEISWTESVRGTVSGTRLRLAEGATTIFTTSAVESLVLIGTDGQELSVKGAAKGIVFADGSVWVIAGNVTLHKFKSVVIADKVSVTAEGAAVSYRLYQPVVPESDTALTTKKAAGS